MNKYLIPALIALVVSGAVAFVPSTGDQSNQDLLAGLSSRDIKAVTLEVTNDATFREDIILKNPTFCIDFYATSTATQNKMTASSTATIEGVDGVMLFGYGSCQ
jgi:hypothetical protein